MLKTSKTNSLPVSAYASFTKNKICTKISEFTVKRKFSLLIEETRISQVTGTEGVVPT